MPRMRTIVYNALHDKLESDKFVADAWVRNKFSIDQLIDYYSEFNPINYDKWLKNGEVDKLYLAIMYVLIAKDIISKLITSTNQNISNGPVAQQVLQKSKRYLLSAAIISDPVSQFYNDTKSTAALNCVGTCICFYGTASRVKVTLLDDESELAKWVDMFAQSYSANGSRNIVSKCLFNVSIGDDNNTTTLGSFHLLAYTNDLPAKIGEMSKLIK